ncbi:sugar phosphate isomerase/epimerase family protein [Bradyrhizobium sp. NP1]|uniref:sugar phosphate isomerase/epimerase family protein n=1 Tax=Bradyrhizobium sp. NP1 TaxID=3049772 RepID=UPI0025A5D2BE|nr:sugar phosphate isomerase/epimerase family protein [Bradyrhizobium sp. NP1]WJR78832.1 sugar phosphate isomerase/epimerase family protein [Bradyrhizobium sp. NP1]
MRIALCNEVIADMPLERQCDYAASLGYDGLEVAPFTLSDTPERITSVQAAKIRTTIESFGLAVTGLHWLLVKPEGLSLTDPDASVRARTIEVMTRLTGLCAELGGHVLVHGSPKQRQIAAGETHATALGRLRDALAQIALVAARTGVTYCIEPLSKRETELVNTVAEGAELVRSIDHPNLRTMIDCSAAGLAESESVAALIDRWLPTGLVAHIQVNDPNRRGPGQGEMQFAPILAALKRNRYAGTIAVEPFDYVPDGAGVAAFSVGYLRGLLDASA